MNYWNLRPRFSVWSLPQMNRRHHNVSFQIKRQSKEDQTPLARNAPPPFFFLTSPPPAARKVGPLTKQRLVACQLPFPALGHTFQDRKKKAEASTAHQADRAAGCRRPPAPPSSTWQFLGLQGEEEKRRQVPALVCSWAPAAALGTISFSQDCFIQKLTMHQSRPLLTFNIFLNSWTE